jgi:PAS domain S-box-containing protein
MLALSPKKHLFFDICIVVSIIATVGITVISLKNGIFDVFPYIYLVPVVLIAFAHPKYSVYATVLVGWLYLGLVFFIGLPDSQRYTLATIWFYVFVSIGVLISIYSQVYLREGRKSIAAYDNSQAGVFCFDKESLRLKAANRKFSYIIRYGQDDLLKKALPEIIPDTAERESFLASIHDKKRIGDIEVRFRTWDGTMRWALVSATVSDGPDIICTLVDITDHKQAQESLTVANKKLNLLNNITRHDILNQLSALLGYIDLSRHNTKDLRMLSYIEKEEQAANTIRSQILFTRDYQNIGVHNPEWYNIAETVSLAMASLDLQHVQITVDHSSVEIYADPLFERVFYNLLENSIRHGEGITTIGIHLEQTADGIDLIVEDDGPGIPEKEKENIFRRKYFKNTGFGLFLSREILSITNLTISENGIPGEGAHFVIHAPKGTYREVLATAASPLL